MRIVRGTAWTVLLLSALAGLPLVMLQQFPGVQLWHEMLVYYATFIPYMWAPILLGALAAIVLVRGLWKFIPIGAFVVAASFWGAHLIGDMEVDTSPRGDLQFVSLNAQYGRADVGELMDQVADTTTVVTIQEINAEMQAALREAGFEDEFPHQAGHPREDAGGTMIYSRVPLTVLDEHEEVFLNLAVELEMDGQTYVVAAVHLAPPTLGTHIWERDARQVAATLEPHIMGRWPTVVVGDFNAVDGHVTLERFFDAGLMRMGSQINLDRSSLATFQPSWPVGRTLPPFAQIDHAFFTGTTSFAEPRYFEISGTDHKGLAGGIWVGR